MKSEVWESFIAHRAAEQGGKPRRKSVAEILRAAYRRFGGGAATRQAVRTCLRSGRHSRRQGDCR